MKRRAALIVKLTLKTYPDPATQSDNAIGFIVLSTETDEVVGDSAFPVALDRGCVLLGTASDLALLDGRILVVVTRADELSSEYFAYLKWLGKPMPGSQSIYSLENVGQKA